MTREQAKTTFAIHTNRGDEYIKVDKRVFHKFVDRVYDDFETKHKYIIELIAHTAGSGNKAISQTLLTIDGILKEMREQK